jgi:acyl transferase domain-containing protein
MYATHLASRALASGEIDGAIVGGTNLILDAAVQMAVDKMGVLSHSKITPKLLHSVLLL